MQITFRRISCVDLVVYQSLFSRTTDTFSDDFRELFVSNLNLVYFRHMMNEVLTCDKKRMRTVRPLSVKNNVRVPYVRSYLAVSDYSGKNPPRI